MIRQLYANSESAGGLPSGSADESSQQDRDGRNEAADTSLPSPKGNVAETNARPIGLKLAAAFAILIAILIGIGILGLSRMDQINAHLEDVLGRHWAKLQLAREALMYSNQNSRITMEIFLVDDKPLIDPLLASRAENTIKISELVEKIKRQCDSPEECQLLADVESARAPYVTSYLRALHLLVDEKQPAAARAVMVQETTPALYKYHAAWSKFMQFQMERMDEAANESRTHYGRTRDLVLLLVILAVIVAVAIAFFVTLKMTEETRTRALAEQEVRVLNADLEQRVERRTQELRQAEQRYRAIFEDAVIGIFQTTPEGRILSANPALAQMYGYSSPEQLRTEVTDVRRQLFVDPNRFGELTQALEERGVVRNVELEVHSRDGSKKWILVNVRAVRGTDGKILRREGTVQDITERKAAEKQVQFLAYYDALTGLPNRTLLQDRLTKALASARRHREKVALLFLDLDRFKTINDSLGHSVGDLLLKEVAERLKKWTREQDTVARLGGDEFVVVLTAVKDIADAAVAADRILKTMTPEFVIQGHMLSITCSLGISVFPDHGANSDTLLKNADTAMYCAKEKGRNNFQFFTQDMNVRAVERLTLESGLRLALERKEFSLVYQPQVDLITGQITGAEALLRWRHPELGPVPPDKFIPIAENSGLIIPIGEWVLRTACGQARRWQNEGLPSLPVAVNVSAVQFRHERFLELIEKVLNDIDLSPQYLELELTERLLLLDTDVVLSKLQELQKMGIKLAIDDFGTGYSSLSYLRQLPLYKLKIDRSFVQAMTADSDGAAITSTIISMGKNLNLKVIAEGVENEDQLFFLSAHNCDEIQGYYFSRPLAPDDFAEKVRSTLEPVR